MTKARLIYGNVMVMFRHSRGDKLLGFNARSSKMIENAISKSEIANVLGFFTETGDLKVDKVSNFLEISRAELATAFELTADKLRPERISVKTKERLKELAGAIEFVAETFDGDVNKAKKWVNSPNLNFGGSSPKNVILKGRVNKIIKFVLAAKNGY